MKIRRYVLNLLLRSNGAMVQLPTSKTLAKQFDCSRPTVSKAMKTLIEDGYVIGKPGIGSFTNPALGSINTNEQPIIGIIFGDGMLVHYEAFFGAILAQVLEQFTRVPAVIHIINLTSNSPEQMIKEIQAEKLDGILWESPTDLAITVIKELREKGIPAVTMHNRPYQDIDCVYFDLDRLGREIGQKLLARNRSRIVLMADRNPWNTYRGTLLETYEKAGIKLNEKLFISDYRDGLTRLREIIELGVPVDAVVNPLFPAGRIAEIFSTLNIDTRKDCTLVNNSIYMSQPIPGSLRYDLPFGAYAKAALETMSKLLRNKESEPEVRPITIPIVEE